MSRDREIEKLGYDIKSRDPAIAKLHSSEVTCGVGGAQTKTVTRNEILYFLNRSGDFMRAIAVFLATYRHRVHKVRRAFEVEPDSGVSSINRGFAELVV